MQQTKTTTELATGTVHTSAKARLTRGIRDPDRQQNLVIVQWPIANLPWKCHANPFGSFCAKLLTDRQTDKQINNGNYISFLAEIINENQSLSFSNYDNHKTCFENSRIIVKVLLQIPTKSDNFQCHCRTISEIYHPHHISHVSVDLWFHPSVVGSMLNTSWLSAVIYTGWSDVTVIYGHIMTSML